MVMLIAVLVMLEAVAIALDDGGDGDDGNGDCGVGNVGDCGDGGFSYERNRLPFRHSSARQWVGKKC